MSARRALALLISLTVLAFAKEPKLKLTWIQAAPGDFVLAGKWVSQRIVVTGKLADGSLHDVTGQTRFKSSNSRVAAVSKAGALLISLTVLAFAKEPKLKLTWIQAAPGDFVLAGKWASQRIVVTGKLADGSLHDALR